MTAPAQTVRAPRQPFPWGKVIAWAALGLLLFVTLFPFYWMLRTAFTFPTVIFKNTSSLLPVQPTLINFQRVLGTLDVATAVKLGGTGQSIDFLIALRNSIIVSAAIVAGQVTFCAMAAYAFARLHFPFRNQLFGIYIAALMVPAIVMTIPNFILVRAIGGLNSLVGIVAPTFLMTPFAVFFLRQFFLGINREVEEAALMDGADVPVVFFRVVLPMTIPALDDPGRDHVHQRLEQLHVAPDHREHTCHTRADRCAGRLPLADTAGRARLDGPNDGHNARHHPDVPALHVRRPQDPGFDPVLGFQMKA